MKILYVTTISLTMNTFFKPHLQMLTEEGNTVDIACNARDLELDLLYEKMGCKFFQIDFSRSPLSVDNIKAYRQLKKIVEEGGYDIVHCHTPNAAVITRLVCRNIRKKGNTRVFYTAHGFHFYKGAPIFNWLVYYPVEKICSKFTDALITINNEDYEVARKKFKTKNVYYVPGVGVNLSRFENVKIDKTAKKREIGVPEEAFLLLSVGELNKNKNHQAIIKTLSKLNNPNIHYAIAGDGKEKENLLKLAKKLSVEGQLHLLGYRNDATELYYSADVFCFPSFREGLGLAAVEAMACGTPVIAADNRGTRSFVKHLENGFLCMNDSIEGYVDAIKCLLDDAELKIQISKNAHETVKKFSIENVLLNIKEIYGK